MPYVFNPFTASLDQTDIPAFNGEVTLGSAASPSVFFTGDPNTGLYSPGADQVALSTNGVQRINIEADGDINIDSGGVFYDATNNRLAIGTASPGDRLELQGGDFRIASNSVQYHKIAYASNDFVFTANAGAVNQNSSFVFSSSAAGGAITERARIDSSGRLLVGTSSARSTLSFASVAPSIQVAGNTTSSSSLLLHKFGADANACKLILLKNRGANADSNGGLSVDDPLGVISFEATDGFGGSTLIGAEIGAYAEAGHGSANDDGPTRLVFSTTADGAASPTERLRITSAGVLQVADAGNIAVGTTTGTKIGTATTQKLGFYNATPVVQPAAVADATDAATVITQLNDLLAKLRTLGIIAT